MRAAHERPYSKPYFNEWGFFTFKFWQGIAMSNTATSEQLYKRYLAADTKNLKASYLVLLKNRASYGSSEAKKFVDKIERCSKTTLPLNRGFFYTR